VGVPVKEYLAERKLFIITIAVIIGFLVFAVFQRPSSSSSDTANAFTTADTSSAMSKGSADAKVSVIQYSDFICPSCSYFSTQIMPTLQKEFVEPGKIKFEFRPMAFIAEGSTLAGMGAYCAIDQAKFWDYHDAIYNVVVEKTLRLNMDPKTQVILSTDDVKRIATTAGLDNGKFSTCLDSKQYLSTITADTTAAQNKGVSGTPYLIINGQHYQGDISLASIEAYIKAQL
jgi:protein-disulfide isomerase